MWQDPVEEEGILGSVVRALQRALAGDPPREGVWETPIQPRVQAPVGQGPARAFDNPVLRNAAQPRDSVGWNPSRPIQFQADRGFDAPAPATPSIQPAAPKARPSSPRSPRPLQQALKRERTSPIAPGSLPEREYADLPTGGILQDDDVAKVLASAPKPTVPAIGPQGSSTLEIPASNKVERGGWKGTLMHALKGALAGASQGLKYSDGDLRGALGGAITGSVGSAINPTRGAEYFQEQIEQPRLDAQTARENALKMSSLELALKQAQTETAGYGPRKAQTDIALDEARIADMNARRGWDVEDRQYQREDREALRQQRISAAKRSEWFVGPGYVFNHVTRERIDLPLRADGSPMSQAEAEAYWNEREGLVIDQAAGSRKGWPDGWRQYATRETQQIVDDIAASQGTGAEAEAAKKRLSLLDPSALVAAERARLAAEQKYVTESEQYTAAQRKGKIQQTITESRRGRSGGNSSGAVRSAGSLRWD